MVRFEIVISLFISPSIYVHLLVRRGLRKELSSLLIKYGILIWMTINGNCIKILVSPSILNAQPNIFALFNPCPVLLNNIEI